jgi:hypothetical protein
VRLDVERTHINQFFFENPTSACQNIVKWGPWNGDPEMGTLKWGPLNGDPEMGTLKWGP